MKETVIKILNSLVERTTAKKAIWQSIEAGFLIAFDSTSYLTLTRYFNSFSGNNVDVINIYGPKGSLIFKADTEEDFFTVEEERIIENLYMLAYESVNKVEETLNNLLDNINKNPDKIIGNSEFNPDENSNPFLDF